MNGVAVENAGFFAPARQGRVNAGEGGGGTAAGAATTAAEIVGGGGSHATAETPAVQSVVVREKVFEDLAVDVAGAKTGSSRRGSRLQQA